MSVGNTRGPGSRSGAGLIAVGLLLIAATPALNLYLDSTPGSARHALPGFLAPAYDQAGKFGVLGVQVSVGVIVTLWGCFLRAAGTSRPPTRRPEVTAVSGNGGSRLMRALGTAVVLDSARYMPDA